MSPLLDLENKDFWNVINRFENGTAGRNVLSSQSPEEWHSYYNSFMNVNVVECKDETGIANLINNFDESITLKEVTIASCALWNNISVGLDCISNEMIKYCSTNMFQCICKLLNLIYR